MLQEEGKSVWVILKGLRWDSVEVEKRVEVVEDEERVSRGKSEI